MAPVAAMIVNTGDKAEPIADSKGVPITDVGYSFEKHFNGQIRRCTMDGKDRRCKYEDGDELDLSLRHLYKRKGKEEEPAG